MKLLNAVLLIGILASCGQKKKGSSLNIVDVEGGNTPIYYSSVYEGKDCESFQSSESESQKLTTGNRETTYFINAETNNGMSVEAVNLNDYETSDNGTVGISNPVIGVYYHPEVVEDLNGDFTLTKRGKPLRFCRQENYDEETIEDIGVSLLPVVSKAFSFASYYIKPGVFKTYPLEIWIQPKHKDYRSKERDGNTIKNNFRYSTDNAFSFQTGGDSQIVHDPDTFNIIEVLPQSEEYRNQDLAEIFDLEYGSSISDKMFGGRPLWKYPFVIAHEFGHYVLDVGAQNSGSLGIKLFKLSEKTRKQSSKIVHHQNGNFFVNPREFRRYKLEKSSGISSYLRKNYVEDDEGSDIGESVREMRMYRFIQETFADLFSFYTFENKDMKQLDTAYCLDDSREVDVDYFKADGNPKKILRNSDWENFLTKSEKYYYDRISGPCDPVFSSPYTVGSIYAHYYYNLMNAFGASFTQAREFLLSLFLNEHRIEIPDYSVDSMTRYFIEMLKTTLYESEMELKASDKPVPMSVCEITEETFPHFADDLVKRDYDYTKNQESCSIL
ncbi:MAG: hypothetical protein H6621_12145 [Halobacteriovoraceae bacterium]|nr:hypothetical protein [Halobacteriovoraceae bacterium]MCB9095811.1 hypothetical protein [Halobacteriovoraceae bacterium]